MRYIGLNGPKSINIVSCCSFLINHKVLIQTCLKRLIDHLTCTCHGFNCVVWSDSLARRSNAARSRGHPVIGVVDCVDGHLCWANNVQPLWVVP